MNKEQARHLINIREEKRCCGTCKWHKPDLNFKGDWICCNDQSEYIADWCNYDDVCEDWEGD